MKQTNVLRLQKIADQDKPVFVLIVLEILSLNVCSVVQKPKKLIKQGQMQRCQTSTRSALNREY